MDIIILCLKMVRGSILKRLAEMFFLLFIFILQSFSLSHADPITRYVSGESGFDTGDCASSTSPCASITYALGQIVEGDTILVAKGTYEENLVITKTVILKGAYEPVDWSRSFRHNLTTIKGVESSRVISIETTLDNTTVIDGFTVTNDSLETGEGGVGIMLSSVDIENCSIVNNHSNFSSGGMRIDHSFVDITNTLTASNTTEGNDAAMITLSTISIPGPNSQVNMKYCTVADNYANGGRHGIFVSLTYFQMINSIVWGHDGKDFAGHGWSVTYSDVEMGVSGESNISLDPLFADHDNGDYHLQNGSPCIDTGTNEDGPDYDFEGDRRPMDGDRDGTAIVDMGADEYKRPFVLYYLLLLVGVSQ